MSLLLLFSTQWSITLLYGADEVVSNSKFNLKASLRVGGDLEQQGRRCPATTPYASTARNSKVVPGLCPSVSEDGPIYHLLHRSEHMGDDKPLSQIVPELDWA